jgi:hypothetical protein
LGGNDNGNGSFATITIVVSLCSLVSTTQKEEKVNDKQRRTNIDKKKKINTVKSLQEIGKKGSNTILI